MKSSFRWYIIGACALAYVAIGQPALADTHVPSVVGAIGGAPAKVESNVKLAIVSGNNQLFTGPELTGTPFPSTNGDRTFPAYKVTYYARAVNVTNLGSSVPIANAAIVVTCHMPAGWLCQ